MRDYCEISGISGMFSGFATIDCAYIYAREGLEETNVSFFGNEMGFSGKELERIRNN